MRIVVRCSIAAVLASTAFAGEAAQNKPVQPSFNCHEATTAVERVICSHDELARLDLDMARRYRDTVTRAEPPARKHLQTEQARWLARRNSCTETVRRTMQQCIEAEYETRLHQLGPPKSD